MKKNIKKRLLFVIPTLDLGGAEKSLINLLNSIDYLKFDVDLFLFYKKGMFLDYLPSSVNIIDNSAEYEIFSKSLFQSITKFVSRGNFCLAISRVFFTLKNRLVKASSRSEQKTWKYTKKYLPNLSNDYYIAIGYLEKTTNYFVVDKVKANKKIGWIHTDLEKLNIDFDFEKKYFEALDYLVTVSDGLNERLRKKIPSLKDKVLTIENINSKRIIKYLASEATEINLNSNQFNIVFVGRLVKEKGIFMAIDSIELLLNQNYNLNFYLIGKGNLEEQLKEYVQNKNLQERVFFLGIQSNPYSILRQANLFLMTSLYEGKSIALEEAKILSIPIVITDFSSSKDQIIDYETGLIAEMNPNSVAKKIEEIIINEQLRKKLVSNLNNLDFGTETEIEKFYKLIDD